MVYPQPYEGRLLLEGTRVKYKGKSHVVVCNGIDNGGHNAYIGIVEVKEESHPSFLRVRYFYDEQIDQFKCNAFQLHIKRATNNSCE